MKKEIKDILVFSGPSGSGKSTIRKYILDVYKQFEFSISVTTREKREGEKDGSDYYFISHDEFKQHINNDDFVEWEEVYPGTFYGTLKNEVERIIQEGKKVIFDIDVLGALNIKKKYKNKVLTVFVKTESMDSLKNRLKKRNSETEEQLKLRIERFNRELSMVDSFDVVLVNRTGDLDGSFREVDTIIKDNFI